MLNLKDYGAIGDNTVDDTSAVNAWIQAMLNTGTTGYVPAGKYRMTERLLFGMPGGEANSFKIVGDGAYKSVFMMNDAPTNQGPQVHFYTASNGPTSCYPTISDIGFKGNTPNTLVSIGLEDFSDDVGNANLTNVFCANENTGCSGTAISLQLNYVFDSVFTNCVAVGRVGYGTALDLRKAVFCNFIGGSYSNAHYGIRFRDQGSVVNTFTSTDIENVNIGIRHETVNSERHTFINPYFDIWRPDLTPAVAGSGHAISSHACAPGGIRLERPFVTARSPAPVIDPSNNQYVTVT